MFKSFKYIRPVLCVGLLVLASACVKKKGPKQQAGQHASQKVGEALDTFNEKCSLDKPLGTVHFDFDKSAILPEAQRTIDEHVAGCVREVLARNPNKKVLITGHADKRGTREYNIALGGRRANATKTYILSELSAIAKAQCPSDSAVSELDKMYKGAICTASKGKDQLTDNGDSEAAHARNRRAEIEIVDHCDDNSANAHIEIRDHNNNRDSVHIRGDHVYTKNSAQTRGY